MDYRTVVTATRAVASIALAALLLYGGMALERAAWDPGAVAVVIALTLAGTIAAVWGLVRLEASRAASVLVLVLLGLAPASAAVGWWFTNATVGGLFGAMLVLNALAGVATIILAGWTVAENAPAREARRAPRVS